nr:unnamed protein product [Callosobruchus analis]
MQVLERHLGCTHINGSLNIYFKDDNIDGLEAELTVNLGSVVSISGNLVIRRTKGIRSLSFLQKLRYIGGEKPENGKYSVFIYENQNLRKLWNFSDPNFHLRINNGIFAFHDNPYLCLSEVEKLAEITGLKGKYTKNDVSHYSNGDNAACATIQMDVEVEVNSSEALLIWKPFGRKVIGYTIFYKPEYRPETVVETCVNSPWESNFTSGTNVTLTKLEPFTNYSYYIRCSTDDTHQETGVKYFKTKSHNPDEPRGFKAEGIADDTINLSWIRPLHVNGKLLHFVLNYNEEPDMFTVGFRNYCEQPRIYYQTERFAVSRRDGMDRQKYPTIYIEPSATSYNLSNLKHFTMYAFYLSACNEPKDDNKCSPIMHSFSRTQRKVEADDVQNVEAIVFDQKDVDVFWSEPTEPNGLIVAYRVMYENEDLHEQLPTVECIPKDAYFNESHMVLSNLSPGTYKLTVQAESVAGFGRPSKPVHFVIIAEMDLAVIIWPVVVFAVSFLGGFYYYWWYKKKYSLDGMHLIASINPECSDLLYEIMRSCWCWKPNDRLTFWDIVEKLENSVSPDFKLVSFIHSREGLEHRLIHGRQRPYNAPAVSTQPREDLISHYNVSDDEVSLHVGGMPRTTSYMHSQSLARSNDSRTQFGSGDLY